jgi:glycosyltransferase involved in cell wall biosynthesis
VDPSRVRVTGELSAQEVAANLAACSLVVQPYADGISGRRTSAMASLALGVPIVTNEGPQTEALWRSSRAVAIADPDTPEALTLAVETLLRDEAGRSALGSRGRELYEQEFSMARTVATLRSFDE